ncbi:serine hydrolase domain-containing protein [Breznakiella homolactica]|uniref:Serine hydrolase n=1 Tax=Breznakiella homolactica TaxID=2798577 RepID=A0A7T8BAN7_9SPIR|nr:serine hydrolase [Breznakiella homolactica]QQO09561.1 beta-lactamase family protein [Breznakiella homolactica]
MDQKKITQLEQIIDSEYSNTVCIAVQKNGKPLYENYFNGYAANNATHVYSVTKSVFSALIGIAIDKGYIKSIDQTVLEFFPDCLISEGEETIQHVTIRDMLTMTAPYKYDSEPYEAFFMSENWMNFALAQLGGKEKTGEFVYSAIVGTHILSGVLAKAAGGSILDFAAENFFSPLGITVPGNVELRTKEEHIAAMTDKNTSGWAADPQGINPAGWGLFLTPSDMTKIGQLYLDGGKWYGKQVVPAWWVAESTRTQSRWGDLSYGFLWWIIDEKEHIYAAMGDGGNVIYINTRKNMVISIAALFAPDAKDRIGLITEYIEPLFAD